MKLLVVSDSHGDRTALEELKGKYLNKVDAMIHCGDSELTADDPAIDGYSIVAGNCDMDSRFPEKLILEIKGVNIFVAHGHLHQIKSSLLPISYKAKEYDAKFVFFGHSHLLGAEMIDGTLFLNPGSISYPRGGNERSYAIIEENKTGMTVKFLNENHHEISQLTRTFAG
ncbi:metallophosphoesterase [Bacillus sp. FSL K6-3431]|uniref:metallophosphoesterase n=1 Tax=Bacillus sp. FSL K6-3431 TaxID=2921500 RepID=UPI0030F8C2C3